MHIESKIKRDGGTHVPMGTTTYHFAPLADGAHVALVENEAHQDRFLSITEGFKLYRGEQSPAAAPVAPVAPVAAPVVEAPTAPALAVTGDVHPPSFTIHGKSYTLDEVAALAAKANGLDTDDWNELSADGRADLIDEELDKLNEAAPSDETDLRAELVEQFKAKFGKAPHHNAGIESIRAKLAE